MLVAIKSRRSGETWSCAGIEELDSLLQLQKTKGHPRFLNDLQNEKFECHTKKEAVETVASSFKLQTSIWCDSKTHPLRVQETLFMTCSSG